VEIAQSFRGHDARGFRRRGALAQARHHLARAPHGLVVGDAGEARFLHHLKASQAGAG
jgi:hypothetical protein